MSCAPYAITCLANNRPSFENLCKESMFEQLPAWNSKITRRCSGLYTIGLGVVAGMGLGIFIVESVPLRVPILYQLADWATLSSPWLWLFASIFLRCPAHMKPNAPSC